MEGVEVGRAYVTVLPNATGFATTLTSSVIPAATTAGAGAGKTMGAGILGGVKTIMGPLAALFAVGTVVNFFKESIAGAEESNKVARTTEQIIKSTGGASKVTAAQVGELATALSKTSGVDDEVIQQGANMLLTFKKVRNEAGLGNQVFDRATQAAVDLSAAGFGSVQSSSKMLGKALNDPVKGLTALGRAGVTFTQEQKDQIKAWAENGDILKAQKAIMAEVESQVGGVGAASANMTDKMAVAWGNFQENIGGKLLPILDKLGTFFIDTLLPGLETGLDFLLGLAGGLDSAGGSASNLLGPVQEISTWFNGSLLPVLMDLGTELRTAFSTVQEVVSGIVQGLTTRLAPMLPVVQQIFGTIGSIITTVLQLIGVQIHNWTTAISFVWSTWGSQIMDVVSAVWTSVLNIINPILRVIQNLIALVMNVIKGDWSAAWENIKGILQGVWDTIRAVVEGTINTVKAVLSLAWSVIRTGVSTAWNAIVKAVTGAMKSFGTAISTGIDKVVTWFKALPGNIIAAIGNITTRMVSVGTDIVSGIWKGISDGYRWITDRITGWVGNVVDFFKKVFHIGSPSKLMADEIGQWLGKGIVVGAEDSLGDAEALAGRYAAALTVRPDVPSGAGARGVSGATSSASAASTAVRTITYGPGSVVIQLSIEELAEFEELIEFLENLDRKIEQGVS